MPIREVSQYLTRRNACTYPTGATVGLVAFESSILNRREALGRVTVFFLGSHTIMCFLISRRAPPWDRLGLLEQKNIMVLGFECGTEPLGRGP